MAVVTEASRVNSKRRELEIENASLKAENQKLAQLQYRYTLLQNNVEEAKESVGELASLA